jgi:hypothetical protein
MCGPAPPPRGERKRVVGHSSTSCGRRQKFAAARDANHARCFGRPYPCLGILNDYTAAGVCIEPLCSQRVHILWKAMCTGESAGRQDNQERCSGGDCGELAGKQDNQERCSGGDCGVRVGRVWGACGYAACALPVLASVCERHLQAQDRRRQ